MEMVFEKSASPEAGAGTSRFGLQLMKDRTAVMKKMPGRYFTGDELMIVRIYDLRIIRVQQDRQPEYQYKKCAGIKYRRL